MLHPNTTGAVLDVLIQREIVDLDSHGVRLAKDPRISATSLEKLALADCEEPIKQIVARNPSTTMSLLERLAADDDEAVSKAAKQAIKQRERNAINKE